MMFFIRNHLRHTSHHISDRFYHPNILFLFPLNAQRVNSKSREENMILEICFSFSVGSRDYCLFVFVCVGVFVCVWVCVCGVSMFFLATWKGSSSTIRTLNSRKNDTRAAVPCYSSSVIKVECLVSLLLLGQQPRRGQYLLPNIQEGFRGCWV